MKINLKPNPYFIAEIGINHNGSYSIAKKMIIKAIKAGANAVKFQKRDVKSLLNFGLKMTLIQLFKYKKQFVSHKYI